MTRILLVGCAGAMGANVYRSACEREDCEVVAGIDPRLTAEGDYPVFASFDECTVEADVIVDFSSPAVTDAMLTYALAKKLPVIVCATGHDEPQLDAINAASEHIAVFRSGNMSLGINLLISLAKKATEVLGGSFDIEIVEQHHHRKVDAPSGTALMIADAVSDTLDTNPHYEYDRHSKRMKRGKNEIGIHSVRGGTIVGVHEVIFAGQDEVLTITHNAQSRALFATGALSAAVFMNGREPGMYDMNDVIAQVI